MTSDMIFNAAFTAYDERKDGDYFKGLCYSLGIYVDIDLEKAQLAYVEGVKKNNVKCMYGLAVLKLKTKNTNEQKIAYSLFSNAFNELLNQAHLGDPISQRMISCYYLFGDRGVEKNSDEAKQWLIRAAENGDMEAQINLAHCYETGTMFKANRLLAIEWYSKAAIQGSKKASQRITSLKEDKEWKGSL